jgi:hypothetical protein
VEPFKPIPIPSFEGIGEAAAHFKAIHESSILAGIKGDLAGIGESCILTSGPPDHHDHADKHKHIRSAFWRRGVRVSIEGSHGHRRITVRGFKPEYEQRR